jgi:hypothetical protein
MRDDGDRLLLVVVGRQPVILRTDEGLEECPGLAGRGAQESDLIRAAAASRGARVDG